MKITVLTVGKVKDPFVLDGEAEYTKRLKPLCRLETVEVGKGKSSASSIEEVKREEAALALQKLDGADCVVVLDERGKQLSSREFARFIEQRMVGGASKFIFAIGGAHGWDDSMRKRADLLLSLSPMTFTYQMCRLFLVEQIYRAFTIIKGLPYSK